MKYKKLIIIIVALLVFSYCQRSKNSEPTKIIEEEEENQSIEMPNISFELNDDAYDIYDPGSSKGYRYGPSIIKNDDGSLDVWLSRPGNNGSMWDYIAYRHMYADGSWSNEETVLRPTPNSLDHYSVCDPGVIYFNGYYYLGYTSTISSDGKQNQIFVARSVNPNGPFEKWNGEGWGGNPEPIISYSGDKWGAGEVSFVVKDEDLYIYYTWYSDTEASTRMSKADICEDWPSTIRLKSTCFQKDGGQDSSDILYFDDLDMFFGFTVGQRMTEKANILIYCSLDGKEFYRFDKIKDIDTYAHNLGVSKGLNGHINSNEELYIAYAYSDDNVWGRWRTNFQTFRVEND